MNSEVFLDNSVLKWNHYYSSLNKIRLYAIGWIFYEEKYYQGEDLAPKLLDLFKTISTSELSKSFVNEVLLNISGNYSFIIESPSFLFCVTDPIRSFPIYFYKKNNDFCVSNSVSIIRDKYNAFKVNKVALLEFQMSGYCIYGGTLYKDISQLDSGSFVLKSNTTFKINRYCKYYDNNNFSDISKNKLLDEFHEISLSVFQKIIKSLKDRPVWIPLSGGYDSRFILSMLVSLGYENITTYTYGVKNLWEVKAAQFYAKKAGVKWIHIPFTRDTKKKYFSQDCQRYIKYATGYNSIAHLADYYALTDLVQQKIIQKDAVIINAQSGDFTS